VVGVAGLHLCRDCSAQRLQSIGLGGLCGERESAGREKQGCEENSGTSRCNAHKAFGCTEVRQVCVAGQEFCSEAACKSCNRAPGRARMIAIRE